MTCKKTQGFLESADIAVAEKVDASKIRMGPEQALELLKGMKRLMAARGKNVVTFELGKKKPADETLLAHMIGPSGNLRAPSAKVGAVLVVGFNEEMYRIALLES